MKKILFILVALFATSWLWAGNVITYTATEKLPETTSSSASGLHTNAFNTTISSHSFSDGVGTITFSGDVTAIKDYAFKGSSSLTSITIPESITRCVSDAFTGCSALTSVIWNAINCEYKNFGGPFYEIRNQITSFMIGEDVINIPMHICYEMSNLTSLTIGSNVERIENDAFYGCTSLYSVIIPESVSYLDYCAFSGCRNITSVVWNATNCAINPYTIQGPFYDCRTMITSFVIGDRVTTIPIGLCSGMEGLTSITIPKGVTSIGDNAFNGCTHLTSANIPNTVTSIGNEAFNGCNSLPTIVIPNSVKKIGYHAFKACEKLTSVRIPNSVTSMGYGTFCDCSRLATVTIGKNVSSLGTYTFGDCRELESVIFLRNTPPSITSDTFSSYRWTKVIVPTGCSDAYESARIWKDSRVYFYEMDLEYTRDVTAGRYGTICLPKSVIADEIEGGVFYNIVYAVTNTQNEVTGILMEEETGDLEAGKAYIYRATADKLVLPYVGDALNDPTTTNGLVGNLSETAVEVPQGMYVLSNNQIRKLNGGTATVGQNKAYIDLTNVKKLNYVPAASPKRVVLNVADGDSVITGVDCIIPNTSTLSTKMLKDGKIIIVNGNRTFDALGNNL